jgi:WhiB family redox-sensing transcriptional regulator
MGNNRHAYDRLMKSIDEAGSVPCQDLPDVFFPEDYLTKDMKERAAQTAKALCDSCPVKMQCFEYAIVAKERFGVWAGTLPGER